MQQSITDLMKPMNSKLHIRLGANSQVDLITISYTGKIEFNTTDYPDFVADDFAREFINAVYRYMNIKEI